MYAINPIQTVMRILITIGAALAIIIAFPEPLAAAPAKSKAKICRTASDNADCRKPAGAKIISIAPEAVSAPAQLAETPARFIDHDCADFKSWREAQDFYIANGPGDPHHLDGDQDGVACEAFR